MFCITGLGRSPFSRRGRCAVAMTRCNVVPQVTKYGSVKFALAAFQCSSCCVSFLCLCCDTINATVGSDEEPFLIKLGFWCLMFSPLDQKPTTKCPPIKPRRGFQASSYSPVNLLSHNPVWFWWGETNCLRSLT